MKKIIHKLLAPFERFIVAELLWMVSKYLRTNSKDSKLKPLRWLVRKSLESLINRMKLVRGDNSFANESIELKKILDTLDIEDNYLVDIGAADGIRQSSTSMFINEYGWSGTLFEYDAESFARLAFLYNDRKDLFLCKSKVSPLNIASLLQGLNVPQTFGYLNIDIDSYDLSVIRNMFESGFKPSVISMEINENFSPDFYFEVLWDENHSWNSDHFFGCSLAAANSTLTEFGYVLVKMEYNNAIFVKETESKKFNLPSNLVQAYKEGYLDKANRLELFPWNDDLEFMHSDLPIREKIAKIDHLFLNYRGKYILKEIS